MSDKLFSTREIYKMKPFSAWTVKSQKVHGIRISVSTSVIKTKGTARKVGAAENILVGRVFTVQRGLDSQEKWTV